MKQKYKFQSVASSNLFDELSCHFINEHNLPPLAAEIYSLLILSEAETLTFEKIIALTGASKSSVSTQINFLIDEGRVDFVFKNDKRKRYFKTKRDYLCKTLQLHQSKIENEIDIISKVIQHKADRDFDKELVDIFKKHLVNELGNISKTIKNIKQTRINLEHHEK